MNKTHTRGSVIKITALIFAIAIVLPITVSAAANTASSKKTTKVAKKTTVHASTSPEIADFLSRKPFFSESKQSAIIAKYSSTSMMNVWDSSLYQINEKRNNQWEENTNHFIPECETEALYANRPSTTTVQYQLDKKSTNGIMSKITEEYSGFTFTFNEPWTRLSELGVATNTVQSQKDYARRTYYYYDPDGYNWTLSISTNPYSQKCLNWIWDRIVFSNESKIGYEDSVQTMLPFGASTYIRRGSKIVNGNDVRFGYYSLPDTYTNMPTLNEYLFTDYFKNNNATDTKSIIYKTTSPTTKEIFYIFKKSNILFGITLDTDRPDAQYFADKTLSRFLK